MLEILQLMSCPLKILKSKLIHHFNDNLSFRIAFETAQKHGLNNIQYNKLLETIQE